MNATIDRAPHPAGPPTAEVTPTEATAGRTTTGVPVLPAEIIGRGQVRVWCPSCERFHIHGLPTDGGTHRRTAHCADPSSFLDETGYYLRPLPKGHPDLPKPPRGRRLIRRLGWP